MLFWLTVSTAAVGYAFWNWSSAKRPGKQPGWAQSAKMLFSGAPEAQITGLRNLGNTCFMNAVLQALSSSSYLLEVVSRGVAQRRLEFDLNKSPELASELDFLQKMQTLLTGQTNDPSAVHNALTERFAMFRGFSQQDAHEFLLFVLDMISDALGIRQAPHIPDLSALVHDDPDVPIEDTCLPCTGLTSSSLSCNTCHSASPMRLSPFNALSLSIPNAQTASLEYCLRVFVQPESVEGVICAVCSMQDTLQVVREKKTQIERKPPKSQKSNQLGALQALEKALLKRLQTIHEENLRYEHSGDNNKSSTTSNNNSSSSESSNNGGGGGSPEVQVEEDLDLNEALSRARVEVVKARRVFSKRLSLARLPALLCLQIQRLFGETKNSRFVPFPLKLELAATALGSRAAHSPSCGCAACSMKSSRVDVEEKQCMYSLRAVVVHLGVSNSGHFITYRRMKKPGTLARWYYISDEQVRPCELTEVLAAEAYLLFYELER